MLATGATAAGAAPAPTAMPAMPAEDAEGAVGPSAVDAPAVTFQWSNAPTAARPPLPFEASCLSVRVASVAELVYAPLMTTRLASFCAVAAEV